MAVLTKNSRTRNALFFLPATVLAASAAASSAASRSFLSFSASLSSPSRDVDAGGGAPSDRPRVVPLALSLVDRSGALREASPSPPSRELRFSSGDLRWAVALGADALLFLLFNHGDEMGQGVSGKGRGFGVCVRARTCVLCCVCVCVCVTFRGDNQLSGCCTPALGRGHESAEDA